MPPTPVEEWPLQKFRSNLAKFRDAPGDGIERHVAVIFNSGSFSPLHIAHLEMMEKAAERLERAGFYVAAGWISPLHQQSGGEDMKLSTDFRLYGCQVSVKDHPFLDVTSWESSQPSASKKPGLEAFTELQKRLVAEMGGEHVRRTKLKVFAVCGGDQSARYKMIENDDLMGMVVVPQPGEDILEKLGKLIFAADPCRLGVQHVRSARIWAAVEVGDTPFVNAALPPELARLALEPTPKERQRFKEDLAKLSPVVKGALWPGELFIEKLPECAQDKQLALLLLSGPLNPVHRGTLTMLEKAKERLEDRGFEVVASWLSPQNVNMTAADAQFQNAPALSQNFRIKLAKLAAVSIEGCAAAAWECQTFWPIESKQRMIEVAASLREHLYATFSNSMQGRFMSVYFVAGTDVVKRFGLSNGLSVKDGIGVIVIPQSDEDVFLDKPSQLMFSCNYDEESSKFRGSAIRNAITAGDIDTAAKALPPAVARFLLAPTEAERAEFQADYDALGVKGLPQAELDNTRDRLKMTLTKRLGNNSSLQTPDISKLLQALDPSWAQEDLEELLKHAEKTTDGGVSIDGFVDWVFGSWKVQKS
eukprot:TRINITY_DN79785_c0_g1_i1.p1 TRINITY_DN79785_c0_g1~~TRINITY_DN79785_c0_g1_i1.p1  ORF type:complete len:590 (-),score=126.75 TRINITY_DN79785_c0_g1_i1:125-1894(-)